MSLALLIVLLIGQALVVFATVVVVGLGHGSAGQAVILFGGVGAASVLLLVLFAGTIRGTSKPVMTVWALAAPFLDVVAYAIVLNAGGLSACTEAEAAALTSVSPPPGVELQGEPRDSEGICAQAFVASVPLDDVVSGYRTSLESDGWTVLSQSTQPGSAEGGSAGSGELTAQRGSIRFWVGVESGPSESGGTYVGGSISTDD